MIAVQIYGGLGNQLFQYAAGYALSQKLGVELQLNTYFYDIGQPVELDFRLDKYCLNAVEVDRHKLPARLNDGIVKFVTAKFRNTEFSAYKEESLAYNPVLHDQPDFTYLMGYWQCAKYFEAYSEQIRQQFTVANAPSDENAELLDEIDNCMAVSLHIRRGAFVSNPIFQAAHGTPALDYYHRAIDLIAEKCGATPVVYAFSDEPDWVEENLKLPYKIRIVSHNGSENNYEDIRLMSRCKHHIIANSSFSWWGAWLNGDPDKIVIAPKQWFADPDMQDHDLVPKDWIQL